MTQPVTPRTAADDLCDALYHSEFHISREQAAISGRLIYDAMLARGWRFEAVSPEALDVERLAHWLKDHYGDAPFGIAVGTLSLDRFRDDALSIIAALSSTPKEPK